MKNLEQVDIKVFNVVPENLATQADQLLRENGSNNRIKDETSPSEWSRERFVNKKDRFKYIIALINAKVVGIIILWKRTIQYHEKPIVVGGLGGVGVQKKHRGKGIATNMLTLARETLNRSDCDIAFLGTNIDDSQLLKIFARIGFVPLKKTFSYIGRSGKLYKDPTSGMIAPIHSQELYNKILKDTEPFHIGIGTW